MSDDQTRKRPLSTDRMRAVSTSSATVGKVRWRPVKSLWLGAMTLVALTLAPGAARWDSAAVFLILSTITLCCGHSVGMHRLLIHRSFRTASWIEKTLVYCGVLVGMAGPFGMMRLHDLRDWAQRQEECHNFFAHRGGFWRDAWWQLHCGIDLDHPPVFVPEVRIRDDRFYRWIERTWMLQQLPLGAVLFLLGGFDWVIWGICCRVSVSLIGHWLVGHFAHQPGQHRLWIEGAAVQGTNLPGLGLVSFGESFHENHHAFPASARLALFLGQVDPGWWFIRGLDAAGLAWEVQTPDNLPVRNGLFLTDLASPSFQNSTPDWLRRINGHRAFGDSAGHNA